MASSNDGSAPMKLRIPFCAMGYSKSSFSSQNLPCILAKDATGNEITVDATIGDDFFEFVLPEYASGGKQQIQITVQKKKSAAKNPSDFPARKRGRPPKKKSESDVTSSNLSPTSNSVVNPSPHERSLTGTSTSSPEIAQADLSEAGTEITDSGVRRSKRRVKAKQDDDFIVGYKALKKEIGDDGGDEDSDDNQVSCSDDDDGMSELRSGSDIAFSYHSQERKSVKSMSLKGFVQQNSVSSNTFKSRVTTKRGKPGRRKKCTDPRFPSASSMTSRGTVRTRAAPGPVLTDPELVKLLDTIVPTEKLEDHYTRQQAGSGYWLKCKHCDVKARTKKDFLLHLKTHQKFDPWKCPKCDYGAPYRSLLASHLNTHSTAYPFICRLCGKGFHYKQKLRTHMEQHKSGGSLQKCKMCNLTFQNLDKLEKHAAEFHGVSMDVLREDLASSTSEQSVLSVGLKIDEELFAVCDLIKGERKAAVISCKQCDFTCSSQTMFITHLTRHHPQCRPYSCTQCTYAARSKHALMVHLKNHVPVKPHECQICGKAYALKYKLDLHLKVHENKREFQCEQCPKAFNTKNEMTKHFKNVHSTERPYVCDVCGKRFKFKTHCNSHMISHTGIKPFHCEVCNKNFSSRASLLNHTKNHQTQYMCEICNKALGSHSGFMAHKRFHDPKNAEACTCPECGKLMQSRSGLQRHRLVMHTNERPHECTICKKRFKLLPQLQNHMIRHSNVKAFKCEICGLALKRKESLRIHMFCHAPVKPYKCGRCGQEYVQKKSLEVHLRVKHAGVKERCSYCGNGFNTKYLLMNHIKRKHERQQDQPLLQEEHVTDETTGGNTVIAAACDQCKQVFLSQHSLAVHILTEHMNQKWIGGVGLSDNSLVVEPVSSSESSQHEECASVAETIEIPCGEEMILIPAVDGEEVTSAEMYEVIIDQ